MNKCLQHSLNPTQVMNIEEFVLSWSTQTLRRGPKFIRDSFTSVDSRSRVCGNGLGDVSGHVPSWLTSCFSGSTPSAFSFSDNMNVYQKSHRQPHAAFVYTWHPTLRRWHFRKLPFTVLAGWIFANICTEILLTVLFFKVRLWSFVILSTAKSAQTVTKNHVFISLNKKKKKVQ